MIEGIGFFEFVTDGWRDPLGSLECELEKKACRFHDAPVVLPEFFNCGDRCDPGDVPAIGALQTRRFLAQFSRKYRVAFVAALVDEPSRFNSAYLIDADLADDPWRLLCHKRFDDCSKLYEPFTQEQSSRNPLFWKGVHVAALICNDAAFGGYEKMLATLKLNAERSVVCIPARMGFESFQNDPILNPHDAPGPYSVLANSKPGGCPSFIAGRRGFKAVQCGSSGANALAVRTWAELDTWEGLCNRWQ